MFKCNAALFNQRFASCLTMVAMNRTKRTRVSIAESNGRRRQRRRNGSCINAHALQICERSNQINDLRRREGEGGTRGGEITRIVLK
jgi:hypothetical protein